MGVRPDLPVRDRPCQHLPELAASLQSPPTPHRDRRKDTHRAPTCSQPAREEQLGRSRLDAKRTRRNSRLPLTTIRVAAVLRSQLRLRHNRPEPIMMYPSSFKHGNRHRPWTLRSEALPKAGSRVTVLRNCIDWWVNSKSVLLDRSKVAEGPE